MSRIPDCRRDEYYNQKYLNDKDSEFVRGFDWCAERAVDNFFDNLDYIDDDELVRFLDKELPESEQFGYQWSDTFCRDADLVEERYVRTFGDLLRSTLAEWIESHRDELITSMIDSMTDEEYNTIKETVDRGEAE